MSTLGSEVIDITVFDTYNLLPTPGTIIPSGICSTKKGTSTIHRLHGTADIPMNDVSNDLPIPGTLITSGSCNKTNNISISDTSHDGSVSKREEQIEQNNQDTYVESMTNGQRPVELKKGEQ